MKKIFSILFILTFLSINFSFGFAEPCYINCINAGINTTVCENKCPDVTTNNDNQSCTADNSENCSDNTTTTNNTSSDTTDCTTPCTDGKVCNCTPTGCKCEASTSQTNTNNGSSNAGMGIECDEKQLVNGQCKLNIYNTLGIRKSVRNETDPTSVGLFVQDVILSATFFIGTLVTVALIVSGIMFIFAASSGKDPANAKKGIMGSLVGLLIVVSSYVIIRLVQYIAKGF